jgi:predicted  nucleic acid-binding Zn-ribbon protein
MTDRYTELVKQAYEAQQAREGERYQSLTSDLARIDADLEALAAKREDAVSVLESMDDAIEAAKEALDAYFAGREESDDALFEDQKPFGYIESPEQAAVFMADSEFETAKANGALTD